MKHDPAQVILRFAHAEKNGTADKRLRELEGRAIGGKVGAGGPVGAGQARALLDNVGCIGESRETESDCAV